MFRLPKPVFLSGAILLVLASYAAAQLNPPARQTNVDIDVRITYENDRSVSGQIRIDLLNETGITIAETFTDPDGRGHFHVTSAGGYRVRASGMYVEDTISDELLVGDMDRNRMLYVRVKPKGTPNVQSVKNDGGRAVTSAAQLKVPPDAQKAFNKGLEAWEKKDYAKAAECFEKAVAQYPEYDAAFNNLGVMYAHLSQPDKSRAAFERSVQLNDKNADADRNLARILLREQQFPRAEDVLRKSLAVEPLNPISLTLLSIAEVESGDIDGGLRDARRAHSVPHEGYALCHYIAGQALEHKGQYQDASVEYQTYLRESPNGPEATEVKTALNRLNAAGVPLQGSAR